MAYVRRWIRKLIPAEPVGPTVSKFRQENRAVDVLRVPGTRKRFQTCLCRGTLTSENAFEVHLLKREEWLHLARKLDWEYSYVREEEVFPKIISGTPWLPHSDWQDWEEAKIEPFPNVLQQIDSYFGEFLGAMGLGAPPAGGNFTATAG